MKTIDTLIARFKQEYQDVSLSHRLSEIDKATFHCFFISIKDEEALSENWENFTSWFAAHFQTKLDSEFEKWNLYLFFLVPEKIELSLRYNIENDTYSSRKIVIEGVQDCDKIIKNHIIISDLGISSSGSDSENESFDKDLDLAKLLFNKSIKGKKKKQSAKPVFEDLTRILKSKKDEN